MNRREVGILCLLVALAATSAFGQKPPRKLTPGDVYCSGMFTTEAIPSDTYMISGEQSNHQTVYAQGDYVYVNRGSSGGVKLGDEFLVMRKVKTPSHWKWFESQPSLLRAMGNQWADLGRLRVVHVESNVAVALVTNSCGYLQRGDIVRPFAERPMPQLRAYDGVRYPAPTGKPLGMVAMGKDFEQIDGMDDVVYINLGTAQGAKTGDYVRVFRYQGTRHEMAYQARNTQYSMWGYGKTPVPYRWSDLPREYLAEGVILRATENASTVFMSYSLKPFFQGDYVELDNPAPPYVEPPPPPPPAPVNRPPSVTCSAERASVSAGESVRIMARGSDPDGDRLAYSWFANAGRVTPQGETATWNSTGLTPGRYSISAQANDGKNAAADCSAYVEVLAPTVAQASKVAECNFASGSSRADNVCKRYLDDIAIRLKNDRRGRVALIGYSDPAEAGAANLGNARAESARAYLQSAGIATTRIVVQSAGGQQGAGAANRRVDLIWVPEGASF
jgi:outer membrane protein OmpA-like peptidoglycan-associated protein